MQLNLSECTAYACPGLEANTIAGLFLVFKTLPKKIDIGHNSFVQKVNEHFFIPENTTLNMALTEEEFSKLCHGIPHFFHHQLGLIELKETLNWATIAEKPVAQFPVIETPAKSVKIPMEVTAFSIEIEPAELSEDMGNPFTDKEVDPKELPFDMEKVLKGNNAEVDKYLNYLKENPDAALKMAIPLDLMGTSRGRAYAKYKFRSNFFQSLTFPEKINFKKLSKIALVIVAVVTICWIGYEWLMNEKKEQPKKELVTSNTAQQSENFIQTEEEALVEEDTEDASDTATEQQMTSEDPPIDIWGSILFFIVVVVVLFVIYYGINAKKNDALKRKIHENKSWLDLPDESELFRIHEEERKNEEPKGLFYFGGNQISGSNKIILAVIIAGLSVYLCYPIYTKDELPDIFKLVVIIIVLRLLYMVVNKNQKVD